VSEPPPCRIRRVALQFSGGARGSADAQKRFLAWHAAHYGPTDGDARRLGVAPSRSEPLQLKLRASKRSTNLSRLWLSSADAPCGSSPFAFMRVHLLLRSADPHAPSRYLARNSRRISVVTGCNALRI
jgi:hypothetical protein